MQQNLLATAAATNLTPWGGLSRRLPLTLTRALPLTLVPVRAAMARSVADPASCARQTASPVRTSRLDSMRHATLSVLPSPARPARAMLRVVRIVETDQAPASSGRILMCGRMADVCAELDRMVEREAAQLARA